MTEASVRQVSLSAKIKMVTGLAGTISVDAKTNEFLENLESATDDGRDTRGLTAKQITWIEAIWQEHFA